MSTIKMQESIVGDEVTQLRKLAADKDNHYATLENELLKKNNDLVAIKDLLNETLCKFRNEADRVLKLELDLNRREEDLRAERLTRQNLEVSLNVTSEKLTSEEKNAKHLQQELDAYASRTSSRHEQEQKLLQREKATLEVRVRALEAQLQANKQSQLPTRLPRPTTFSAAASTAADARIATLECGLSKAERELAEASRSLAAVQQEAAKVPRLQSDLIVAENARMRAEKAANSDKADADNLREILKEREEELQYWRSTAGDKSVNEGRLEDAVRERDEAIKSEQETRRREIATRRRLEEMEAKEAELVMEREEALNEMHRLQAELQIPRPDNTSTLKELRATLAERETALLNARGYTAELQQMYRDTLSECEDAEARVRDLEGKLRPREEGFPPLVIVSPPPSPSTSTPFLAQPKPTATLSADDEAVIARLLTAIERLRGERDAMRRDLHFAKVEHRMTEDSLRARVEATECELRKFEEGAASSKDHQDKASIQNTHEMRRLIDEVEDWRRKFEGMDAELKSRAAEFEVRDAEMQVMQVHIREIEESRDRLSTSHRKSSQIALSSFVIVQHLQSELHQADASIVEMAQIRTELLQSREDLARTCDELVHSRDELAEARDQAQIRLIETIQNRDEAIFAQQTLRHEEIAANDARLVNAVKEVEERDVRIADLQAQLSELRDQILNLQCELSETRQELSVVETRHSAEQLSTLTSTDNAAAEALKSQLEVLQQRVLRRTEQIGMLQHDTKRLETNLQVAEDTIGELTAELETVSRERACLVEDCAQARETRDQASKKVEELEVEVETLTKEHEELREVKDQFQDTQAEVAAGAARIEAMVRIVVESMTRSRTLSAALKRIAARLTIMETNVNVADSHRSHAVAEVENLTSELESMAVTLRNQTVEIDALTQELSMTKDESQRLSAAFEHFKDETQSREQDNSGQAQYLIARVEELEGQLAAAQASEDALSQELRTADQHREELQAELEQLQQESKAAAIETRDLSSTVASLEQALELQRTLHAETLTRAHHDFTQQVSALEVQVEKSQKQRILLEEEHAGTIQDLTVKLEEAKSHLEEARAGAASRKSLEFDLRRLESEHADELLLLRSRLDESIGQTESLQTQLQMATEAIADLESEIEMSGERYDAAQVEIRGLEHALTGTRAQLDEHDASIYALQREKTALQIEHTRLEAELDKLATKHQYVEQQVKRSDHEGMRLKSEVERLRGEAAKFDEAAQAAEVNLSFKTNQFEQKLAVMQRELQKQQNHRQCQEGMAELNEKIEYLEEMLRMKSVEIEDNDDRFIDALKEKKRLTSKVESLTRKVQSLQTKVAALTTTSDSSVPPPPLPTTRPKTPSPPIPTSMPSAGPSARPPTRIPSSPAVALRAKTPEPSRRAFASRLATPEPPVPPLNYNAHKTPDQVAAPRPASRVDLHQALETAPSTSRTTPPTAPSTPLSSGSRKRRAPDDFDSIAPLPAQAIVAPSGNTTPRRIRHPTNESRSGFTPTRNGTAGPSRSTLPQPSPLRRSVVPLGESTNSPRTIKSIGLGKPASVAKPSARSWLSRNRAPTTAGGDIRSMSVLGV